MVSGAAEVPGDFELWPEHWDAWCIYLRCASQWRVVLGFSHAMWLGLDYAGVEIVMRRSGIATDRFDEVFDQVQVFEDEERALRNSI